MQGRTTQARIACGGEISYSGTANEVFTYGRELAGAANAADGSARAQGTAQDDCAQRLLELVDRDLNEEFAVDE